MNKAICPICEEKIELVKKIKFLERLSCPTCEALLEVVNLDPVELDWIYYDEYYDSNGKDRTKESKSALCPLCRDSIHLNSHVKIGDRIICPGCDAQLEVVSLIPAELDWPYDGGFDYYSQDDEFYEDSVEDY
jgi:C4-type Zn-finger protein